MTNLINLNSAYYYILRDLSMMGYIIVIWESKFANIWFGEFDQSEPGSGIKFRVYFNPLGYVKTTLLSVS